MSKDTVINATKVNDMMKSTGISQAEMARHLGVNASRMSQVLNPSRREGMKEDKLRLMAEKLGVSVSELTSSSNSYIGKELFMSLAKARIWACDKLTMEAKMAVDQILNNVMNELDGKGK